ncbi:MarR family transcriptional regulator [Micromonospora aurantiaca]|uniref:hypothetical protein n=1 Tax=Micromonospora aurantiaca (nom. illeg.) TaxID=47850 RepID=UPI000828181C|nr:hypothetical protein [Micromonospora aurantiaca]SCL32830.1 hypothetical protein GA0070615_2126 [Micromonospora aurantiaca]
MTSTPTSTTTAPLVPAPLAPSVVKVLAALHRLGEAAAATIATEAGLGYSTTTPKLRTLHAAGLAEPTRSDTGATLWRITDTGRAHIEQERHGQPAPEPATRDTDTSGTAVEHGLRGGDGQKTGEAAGQNNDQRPAAEVPADGQPEAGRESTSPAAGDVETAPDEDCGAGNSETDHGEASDGCPAEPEVPVMDGTGPAIAATTVANDADAEPATPGDQAAGTAADSTTGGLATEAPAAPPAPDAAGEAAQAPARRASGTLRGAILDVLEANPGRQYKVSELCRLVDRANEGTGAKKASAGAVHNAAVKLVGTGRVVLAVEKPATFALADTTA